MADGEACLAATDDDHLVSAIHSIHRVGSG
jgi:hypothetical protein